MRKLLKVLAKNRHIRRERLVCLQRGNLNQTNWKSQEAETPESEEKVKTSRFSEEQVLGIMKQAEAGETEDLGREHGISPATFYTWRSKYGRLELS